MQDDLEIRRKRLRFRANHRGTKELDIYLGGFADNHLWQFDEDQLNEFEAILNSDEVTLYAWISSREVVPANHINDVMIMLLAYQPPAGSN